MPSTASTYRRKRTRTLVVRAASHRPSFASRTRQLKGADVRKANCDSVIGDEAFVKLVAQQVTPLTVAQSAWRTAILPLIIAVPAALAKPIMAASPPAYASYAGLVLALCTTVAFMGVLKKNILMVKQGKLCFAQYFENGTTHVLQAGVQLVASFGTTSQTFDVKEDRMQYGTVSFVRVRPGFIGIATDNGMPVLLLPGQHLYNNANFALLDIKSISESYIKNGPLTLVRVSQGYLGLASINKRPVILEAGMHYINSPGFEMKKAPGSDGVPYSSVNESLITNGSISIIRISPGSIGLATSSKQPVLLGAGLHYIADPSFEYSKELFVASNQHINNGPMNLVRVKPGYIGLAMINKAPVILDTGMHFIVEPTFELEDVCSINEDLIQIGPVKIIRVGPGMVGLATMNGRPLLLDGGVHYINEPSFKMDGTAFRRQDSPYINLGPLHVLIVPRGKLVPVVVNGEGHFLLEGRHTINQARFTINCPLLDGGKIAYKSLTDEYITAGTRHRIIVPRGKLGLALEQGEPVVYEPGSMHLVNSPLFQYQGSVDVTQQVVKHGSLKIVTVNDGQVGITYNDGVLELFQTGRHTITAETHILAGFVSTGQQTLRISEVTGMTLDNVELQFDAAICIRVVDAQKAVTTLATGQNRTNVVEEMFANVQERAKLDLCTIIGKNRFNKKHVATTTPTARDGKSGVDDALASVGEDFEKVAPAETAPEDAGFRSAVHDSFMVLFKEEMSETCGVEVINMAVEDARITDPELAKGLAAAAVANSALEKQNIEAEIVQVKANAEAKVATIDAQGKANAMKVISRAEADRIKTVSDALESACPSAQHNETIRTSGDALKNNNSTVVLAQDMSALPGVFGFRKHA